MCPTHIFVHRTPPHMGSSLRFSVLGQGGYNCFQGGEYSPLRGGYINTCTKLIETARRFVSLNISLSHSKSLKIIRNDTLEYGVGKSLFIVTNYVYVLYNVRDKARKYFFHSDIGISTAKFPSKGVLLQLLNPHHKRLYAMGTSICFFLYVHLSVA